MTTEILQKNPLEDATGLSPEQRHRQMELGHKALRLQERQARLNERIQKTPVSDVSSGLRNNVAVLSTGFSQKLNSEARTSHYLNNQGAYQEQAVKDAAAEDVHTTFGT